MPGFIIRGLHGSGIMRMSKETIVQECDATMMTIELNAEQQKALSKPKKELGHNKVGGIDGEKYFCKPF